MFSDTYHFGPMMTMMTKMMMGQGLRGGSPEAAPMTAGSCQRLATIFEHPTPSGPVQALCEQACFLQFSAGGRAQGGGEEQRW